MARNPRTRKALVPMAENIKTLRAHYKMTQDEFAKWLGVCSLTVSHWETGTTAPDAMHILTICYKTGVSADCLLGVPKKWRKFK